ncbi:PQQ-like beta-propeller repeat protein [Candidatus Poribacteria bacterium]|nr:PQQ-like beta-propeller repeat protein [Candidatus Poribacteria bacterium]
MKHKFTIYVWIVTLLCSFNHVSIAQEWPQWRGPNRDGIVTEFSMPEIWPDALKLKWKVEVGTGHASPVVADEKIYLHTRQDNREIASCLSLDTGELLWRKDYPAPYKMNPAARGHGKGPKSTPVLHEGKLYTLGISGILSCFDAETGDIKWQKEFSNQFEKTSPTFGTAMSPIVRDTFLIAHVGGHDNGALIAFDAETGDIRWRWDGDGPGYASPIAVELQGTMQIVTQTENYCIGVSADTGELLWEIPFTTAYDQNIVTPLVYQQMLIFSGMEKGTMGIKVTKRGREWSTEQIWHNPDVSMYMNSPVLSGNLLFGLSHKRSGQFFCLDARNGSTLWTSGGRQGKNAAILSAGDMLFLLTNDAELIVAKQSAKGFEPIARYTVADSPTWAHPVVLDKHILVKDAKMVILWSME